MIAIVGAGLTGLALGRELAARGAPYLILEAADRPGGVVRSARVRGHLLEWGPQRTRLTPGVRELVDALGLGAELVTAPRGLPLYVYRSGKLRLVPFSARDLLRSDLLSLRGKLRLLLEPLTAGARDEESVASYLSRKLGREAYESLTGPLYGGLYASDPADMVVGLSLGHVLRELGIGRSLLAPLVRRGGSIDPPPACSFREGMQALPDALHAAQRDRVRLGTPVRAVRRAGAGYRLELDDGVVDAAKVVVTTPAPAAARMLEAIDAASAARIGTLVYNPLAIVHLHAGAELTGLGYQVSLAEDLQTRGVTFNSSLFGRRGVYTAYLGGAKSPEVVERSDDEIAEVAVREFRRVTGLAAEPLSVAREAMPAWDRSWAALRGLRLPPGIHAAANWESRPGVPGRLMQARRLAAELTAPADRPPSTVSSATLAP